MGVVGVVGRVLAGVVSGALVWSALPIDPASGADPTPASAPPAASDVVPGADGLVPLAGGVVRPDWTSAAVTARASQVPVEVLSERSETRRVWVFADGHVREEVAGAPVRFKDPAAVDTHGWRSIDTTLVSTGDGVKASLVPGSATLV